MCSPCGPMVCYKYEDCGPSKGKASNGGHTSGESGAEKKAENEIQLKRIKSRELRGGIMYYSCHCIKRNGLQHDCRRTGCGGEPACLVLPDPLCAPSQLARTRGLADAKPLEEHMYPNQTAGGGASGSHAGQGGGKRFIVCELKGVLPETAAGNNQAQTSKCCKCPVSNPVPKPQKIQECSCPLGPNVHVAPASRNKTPKCCVLNPVPKPQDNQKCSCPPKPSAKEAVKCCRCPPVSVLVPKPQERNKCRCCCPHSKTKKKDNDCPAAFECDQKLIDSIIKRFESKDQKPMESTIGWPRPPLRPVRPKEEPCTRAGCQHWQPPPPCIWDLPCKADCFETPPGIQPGRNPLGEYYKKIPDN